MAVSFFAENRILREMLNENRGWKDYDFHEPSLSPLLGGILYAYAELGIPGLGRFVSKLAREGNRLRLY
ncbi:hypothetical protein DRW41_09375 [Neobacillus piezotolerans]|uniref:Uncharacterized protein n=1 Tax=Neobacillus piezotolerans TaxID=2259171 RepID=A0A3D8GQY3_9BACI|nr:hypothetical protein DRW41_09375 [Neobacillus piezotolerans]